MPQIFQMPPQLANLIAAGEVVERPGSVVKELVENAVDAGATSIVVEMKNGGKSYLRVTDDGCGIPSDQVETAFLRHATSKISNVKDLDAIGTLGFRGEALASIASIAQVELITRRAEAEIGTKVVINGGEFVSQTPVAASVGSQFLIRNIFYNTPGRRKFIDERQSQLPNMIKTEFRRIALCHPEVAMELMCDKSPIYTLPQSSRLERIINIIDSKNKICVFHRKSRCIKFVFIITDFFAVNTVGFTA